MPINQQWVNQLRTWLDNPNYVARGEARPGYQRAFAAQLAVNAAKPPAG